MRNFLRFLLATLFSVPFVLPAVSLADLPLQQTQTYSRERDVKWHAEQQALWLLDLERIDERIKTMRDLRRAGRTITAAIALEGGEDGDVITPEAAIAILEKKRREILAKVDQLEDVAHRNDLPPGDIRSRAGRLAEQIKNSPPLPPPPATAAADSNEEMAKDPESYWRKRFAEARDRLYWNEKELSILQREYNKLLVGYFPNPQTTLVEGITFNKLNRQYRLIEDKRAEVADLRRALSDLEDDLRRAGGYPGWAR
jgi:hypothetical protein